MLFCECVPGQRGAPNILNTGADYSPTPHPVLVAFCACAIIPDFRSSVTPILRRHTIAQSPYLATGAACGGINLSDVYYIFPCVGGLARQNPNNVYLIGRTEFCYFSRRDLPKLFWWYRALTFRKTIFSDARFIT